MVGPDGTTPDWPAPEPPDSVPGVPDAFERLWTPHRMVYVGGENRPTDASEGQCPFCRAPHGDDDAALIVHRGTSAFVVLNLYPYNPGHVLVCPYRHVADWTDLTAAERTEVGELTASAMRVIRAVSAPHGFNLGMNQGPVAGAGIAAHLHQHVVPRWGGDANFLPIIARTKALPEVLGATRALLAGAWATSSSGAAERGAVPDGAEADARPEERRQGSAPEGGPASGEDAAC